jgi:O-antigen/teichoic acid export membrane protein
MLLKRLKEFGKDASFYGLSQIMGQLIGFFLIPLYTKFLTTADYGIMTLLGFYTLFYSPISHLGIQGALFRFIGLAKNPEDERIYTSTALKAVVVIGLVITLLSLAGIYFLENVLINSKDYTLLLAMTILGAFPSSLAQFGYSLLRIKRKVKLIFWLNNFNLLLSISLNIWFIVFLEMGLLGATLTVLVSSILSLLSVLFFVRFPVNGLYDNRKLKDLLRFGLPNVPHYLISIVMMLFGQYMLNRILSANDLGLYAVAWKFCLPLQAIIGIAHSSWAAYKYEIVKSDSNHINVLGQFGFIMIFAYSWLFITTIFFSEEILVFMTDESYHGAGKYVGFLALIPLMNGLYYIFGMGVSFGKSQYFVPLISGLGCLITVVASFYFIPEFGIIGAGIVTAIGWFVMAIGAYIYGQHLFRINFKILQIFILLLIDLASLILLYYWDLSFGNRAFLFLCTLVVTLGVIPSQSRKTMFSIIKTRALPV